MAIHAPTVAEVIVMAVMCACVMGIDTYRACICTNRTCVREAKKQCRTVDKRGCFYLYQCRVSEGHTSTRNVSSDRSAFSCGVCACVSALARKMCSRVSLRTGERTNPCASECVCCRCAMSGCLY